MKNSKQETTPSPKSQVTYITANGDEHTWYYDKTVTTNGPYKVDIKHSKATMNQYKKLHKEK